MASDVDDSDSEIPGNPLTTDGAVAAGRGADDGGTSTRTAAFDATSVATRDGPGREDASDGRCQTDSAPKTKHAVKMTPSAATAVAPRRALSR